MLEALERLEGGLIDAMIALQGFEHEPLPHVARRGEKPERMCRQMAEAVAVFRGPTEPRELQQ